MLQKFNDERMSSMKLLNQSHTILYFLVTLIFFAPDKPCNAEEPLTYTISREVLMESKPDEHTWFHPRVTTIPRIDTTQSPTVLMTLQKLLPVSDYFSGLSTIQFSIDSQQWSKLKTPHELGWQKDKDSPDVDIAVADVTPGWHPATKKIIAIGAQVRYSKKGHQLDDKKRAHQTAYAVYDPKTKQWTSWKLLEMPEDKKFDFARCACSQWLVEPDGSLLLAFYHGETSKKPFSVSVIRCTFDGSEIKYKEQGNELNLKAVRGLVEPSLIKFQNKYYLTIRNDLKGYVSTSKDGLNFSPIKSWTFDDGKDLGSYNTQQHWLAHSDGLFLVYTRRGANNDHIMRHRAPLFIAQVDPKRLVVLRKTEKVLIPLPAQSPTFGNFGAAKISNNESWVTVGERRNYKGIPKNKRKSNKVYIAKIKWSKSDQ